MAKTLKIKSFLCLAVGIGWTIQMVCGQQSLKISSFDALKDYLDKCADKPPEVRAGEITLPVEFPLLVNGDRIRSFKEDRHNKYLVAEGTPVGRRYLLAKIAPNLDSLREANVFHTFLSALCGSSDANACLSLLDSSLDRGELSANDLAKDIDVSYVYSIGDNLNFLSVDFMMPLDDEALEDRRVIVRRILFTSLKAHALQREMTTSSDPIPGLPPASASSPFR